MPSAPASVVTCTRCAQAAVISIRSSGQRLCRDHFLRNFEERFRAAVRRQLDLKRERRLAVALSGGKDSTVTLRLLAETIAEHRDINLIALAIDEGIPGYRDAALVIAQKTCDDLGIDLHIHDIAQAAGHTVDVAASVPAMGAACGFCGVWRRTLLNRTARDLGVDRLILGHNLDDLAQTVLLNVIRGEPERLARMGPHDRTLPGMVPRAQPLERIPEREVQLYAILRRWPFHDGVCPHAGPASRNRIRDWVYEIEDRWPGTRHQILKTHSFIRDLSREAGSRSGAITLSACGRCGEPTSGDLCRPCHLSAELVDHLAAREVA